MFFSLLQSNASQSVLLTALDDTVLDCPDKIFPGYLHGSNVFIFYLEHGQEASTGLKELVMRSRLERHTNVVILQDFEEGLALVEQLNVFKDAFEPTKVWSIQEPLLLQEAVIDFQMQVQKQLQRTNFFLYFLRLDLDVLFLGL